MELHLKINDVVGMDDQKRHIIMVDAESLRVALLEHPRWITQCVVKEFLLKHNTRLLNEILEDPTLRNNIYMAEKAKREQREEVKRQRIHTEQQLKEKREEAKRVRVNEQFMKSMEYRRSVDFYRDILGIEA